MKCIGDSMEKRYTDVVMYKQWICVDEHGNRPETAPHLNKQPVLLNKARNFAQQQNDFPISEAGSTLIYSTI